MTPGHDITGDVLLELDLNMLKELDITAFGQRMRLSVAINELRRPPSVGSSAASSRCHRQSSFNSRNADGFNSGPQNKRLRILSNPESISPSLGVSRIPMMDKFSNFAVRGAPEMCNQPYEDNTATGQLASGNSAIEGLNSVCSTAFRERSD